MYCTVWNNLQPSNWLNSVVYSERRNAQLYKFDCIVQSNLWLSDWLNEAYCAEYITFVNAFYAVLWKKWRSTVLKIKSLRWFNSQLTYCKLTVSVAMLYKWKVQKINLKNVIRLNYERPEGQIFWKNQYLKRERLLLKDRELTK